MNATFNRARYRRRRPAFIVGALLADAARYSMAAGVVIVLGLILGYRPDGGPVGVVAAVGLVLVFAFGLSWVWTTLGLIMRTPQSLMMASMTVIFPVTFLSNIFVDPATMPGWLEAVVDVNPVSHLATASRGLMGGDANGTSTAWGLASAAILTAAFAPITMRLYSTRP